MEIWSKAQREEREKAKEEEKKSESASSLCDNDEFFSLLAKEIEDVLASARNDAFGS
jgi:hypothetical protein